MKSCSKKTKKREVPKKYFNFGWGSQKGGKRRFPGGGEVLGKGGKNTVTREPRGGGKGLNFQARPRWERVGVAI